MASKTQVSLSTLNWVILNVKNTGESLPFYRDVLGMKVKLEVPGWVELNTGHTTVALHGTEGSDQPHEKAGPTTLVFQVDNVYEVYESLKASGVKFAGEPRKVCEEGDKDGISAEFHDPDGNLLSVFSYVKKKDGSSDSCAQKN